ncbi:MAG TPA: hypothetical protein VNW92_26155, partial [Polyangiaceae bacterium]|nr:hypothetical protein [Polyangiaceae bacterium]
ASLIALLAVTESLFACSLSAPSITDFAQSRGGEAGISDSSGGGGQASLGGETSNGGDAAAAGVGASASGGNGGAAGVAGAAPDCVAQPEICNGKDDNCDNVIDDGCPSGSLRGSADPQAALGDSTGGSKFADTCANDEVIVGLQVAFSSWLDQVTAVCQKYSLHVNTVASPYQYSLSFGATAVLPAHPTSTSDSLHALTCAPGKVLVGLDISEQHTALGQTPDYIVVTRISATCADPILVLTGGSPHVGWQNAAVIGPLSGTIYASAQAVTRTDLLGTDHLSVGFHGASGLWIDQVGLTASSIGVSLQ